MIIVIADDITGAAEIASIAWSRGLSVSLALKGAVPADGTDVCVIATDTRSMPPADAVRETRSLAAEILGSHDDFLLFKKTDSVLRGHVAQELLALMSVLKYRSALYLPANPSKGRIIKDGIYYINGTKLHETNFCDDPEFPARTSSVLELLNSESAVIYTGGNTAEGKINVGNAESVQQYTNYLAQLPDDCLVAGAADCFKAFLDKYATPEHESPPRQAASSFTGIGNRKTIVVLGSTFGDNDLCKGYSRHALTFKSIWSDGAWSKWLKNLVSSYEEKSVVIEVDKSVSGGADLAAQIRCRMATAMAELVERSKPREIVISGGATTFAIISHLGWDDFSITDQLAEGVVRMKPRAEPGVHITIKPGSYPWPEKLFC